MRKMARIIRITNVVTPPTTKPTTSCNLSLKEKIDCMRKTNGSYKINNMLKNDNPEKLAT
jgi:hypothetical protein